MDDNTHSFLASVTVFSLGIVAGAAVWRERWRVRRGLRLIGFWSYLAAINGGAPEMKLVLEADEAGDEDELVRPYWGYEEPWLGAHRDEPTGAEALSGPTAAVSSRNA